MERDNNRIPAENTSDDRFVDERTREKIHKHISDPNSKITEEDIANVNTDIFKRPDEELTDEALKGDHSDKAKEPKEEKEEEEEEETPKAPNTWDILEE